MTKPHHCPPCPLCVPELHQVPVVLVDAFVAKALPSPLDHPRGPLLPISGELQGSPGGLKVALVADLCARSRGDRLVMHSCTIPYIGLYVVMDLELTYSSGMSERDDDGAGHRVDMWVSESN